MSSPTDTREGKDKPPTADEAMSIPEKEALVEQIEEFEGPDRREKRGTKPEVDEESGVARS